MLEVSTEADILAMASQTADEVARVMLRADEAERDEVTLARVRAYMIAEYARVAEVNRGKNHARKTWRNRAFLTLAGALLMTFGGLVATFALGG
jgi:DNA-directed RNA polymerase specialized sigma24 family protein